MKRHKAHKLHYNGHIFTFIYIRGIHISSITLHAISKLWLNGKIVNGLKDMPFRGRQYRILLEEYNVIYSLNLYHHRTYYTRWLWGTNDPHYHRYRATEYRCWQLHTNPFSRKLWYFDFDAWIPTIGGITPNDTNTFIHTFIHMYKKALAERPTFASSLSFPCTLARASSERCWRRNHYHRRRWFLIDAIKSNYKPKNDFITLTQATLTHFISLAQYGVDARNTRCATDKYIFILITNICGYTINDGRRLVYDKHEKSAQRDISIRADSMAFGVATHKFL